ncbi:MAG: hypothetical protein PHH98_02815 [Candidatus Gracilibacteria bacterium]|nr:hypothetical protein [Candidatus Gracilibacteria bacterium]
MSIVNQARMVSCDVGESSVIHILGCEKKQETKGADLYLDDATDIEVKCRQFGQPVNVLIDQLLELRDSDIYALVYYKMINGHRPVKTIKMSGRNRSKGLNHLRKMMQVSQIFLFPQPQMIDFYNNSKVKEATISSSGLRHKGLSVTRATEMFQNTKKDKAVFQTPLDFQDSPDAITYVIGEKVVEILGNRGYEKK